MPAADEQHSARQNPPERHGRAGEVVGLVLQVQEGSREAFRELVERYMKHAYNVAYRVVGNHHDSEEIAQEAFVRAHGAIASFRGEAEFSTWLYRIVMNLSLNRLKQIRRNSARMVSDGESLIASVGNNPATDPGNDVSLHIERALHELPTLQRAVVILRHFDGLSTRQVSTILRCSEGTVKTHLYRGLKKMKSKLGFLRDEA